MRKFLFVGMLALLFSCANQDPEFLPDSAVAEADTYSDRKIGLSEAENYARLFFGKLKATKGSDDARFSVDYYIEDGIKTKSTSLPSDTLAYIMNDADGYRYCYKVNSGGDGWQTTPSIPDENSEIDENKAFLNCDWGWGGTSNGYYQGEVFDAKYHKFKNMIYFPVVTEY